MEKKSGTVCPQFPQTYFIVVAFQLKYLTRNNLKIVEGPGESRRHWKNKQTNKKFHHSKRFGGTNIRNQCPNECP